MNIRILDDSREIQEIKIANLTLFICQVSNEKTGPCLFRVYSLLTKLSNYVGLIKEETMK